MIFLSAWGEKLITPYKPKINGDGMYYNTHVI